MTVLVYSRNAVHKKNFMDALLGFQGHLNVNAVVVCSNHRRTLDYILLMGNLKPSAIDEQYVHNKGSSLRVTLVAQVRWITK